MPSRAAKPQLSSLFERALDVPVHARGAFLADVCGSDAALRGEIESLLQAHDSANEYFDSLANRLGLAGANSPELPLSASPIDLLPALRAGLADSYRIERELGGGGMSRVFLAEEIALRRRVVIKTLPPDMSATVNIDRFRREIAVIAQLQHPHIVPLFTANASGLLLYYTMPYVAGESLRQRLAAGNALALDEALRIWRDVLDALAYAHANGVVHRDIKPANILLSGRNAMVTDFGIARAIEAATHDSAMMTGPIGTPAYMAPEQATAQGSVDHRADLYAAGLVMYEMLAGSPPFDASSARDFMVAHACRPPKPLRRPDASPRLLELVMQCLAKGPRDRPESAEAILAALETLPASRVSKRTTGARVWHAAGYTALAGALVVAGVAGWRSTRRDAARAARQAPHIPADSVVRLYQRGITEQRRRTLEGAVEALSLFDRAIAADSEYVLAWAASARTAQFANIRGWTVAGRSPDSLLSLAVRASRRAVALDSSSAEAWTVAGKVAGTVDLEDRGATLHALQRALALDSTYAEAWFELGLAYEEALQPKEAERAWLRAAALSPTNAQVLGFLGFHYLWYDDVPAGVRWADSAIAVDPTFFLARDAAAHLALAVHHPSTAIRHEEAALRVRGYELPIPYCVLATAFAREGKFRRARQYALQAESLVGNVQRPSKHEVAYIAAAWAAVGDTARALRWLETYTPRADLHYQLHLKRDPELRWIAAKHPSLLTP